LINFDHFAAKNGSEIRELYTLGELEGFWTWKQISFLIANALAAWSSSIVSPVTEETVAKGGEIEPRQVICT
jgi:hypothetical protein